MTGLERTHKCSKRNSVINIQDFPARNASDRASIALRRSAKDVPACRRSSPPASCTCICSAAVDASLHSFKNAHVIILDNDRSLSRITTCKCALSIHNHCRCRVLCRVYTPLTTAPRICQKNASLFALETSCPVLHFVEAQVHSTSK